MYEWQKYEVQINRIDSGSKALQITKPEDVLPLFKEHAKERDQESFWVLALDHKNQCIGVQELYRGTTNGAAIRNAEVFRLPILAQAACLVIVHNHPSGQTEPSDEDIALTESIFTCAVQLDIDFLYHVIVTGDEVLSLRRHLATKDYTIWHNESHMAGARELIEKAGLLV